MKRYRNKDIKLAFQAEFPVLNKYDQYKWPLFNSMRAGFVSKFVAWFLMIIFVKLPNTADM